MFPPSFAVANLMITIRAAEWRSKSKAKIFLNPDIAKEEIIAYIVEKFRLQRREVKVIADGSKHYHYAEKDEG